MDALLHEAVCLLRDGGEAPDVDFTKARAGQAIVIHSFIGRSSVRDPFKALSPSPTSMIVPVFIGSRLVAEFTAERAEDGAWSAAAATTGGDEWEALTSAVAEVRSAIGDSGVILVVKAGWSAAIGVEAGRVAVSYCLPSHGLADERLTREQERKTSLIEARTVYAGEAAAKSLACAFPLAYQ